MITSERSYWWWVKKKKQMAMVFIAITMMLQLQMKECVGCLETERIGLLQLKSYVKNVLNTQDDSILQSWSHDAINSDCCLWERVNCSVVIGGHISHLSLDGLILYPPWSLNLSLLHSFPQLKSLNFSGNGLTHLFDPIHGYKSFQRLEMLRTLDFSENSLNNSILPFLSAAKSLRTISLRHNELKGVFPPNEIAKMRELRVLNLQSNEFNFFSVQGLINFTELEELDLSYNSISDVKAGDGLRTTKLRTLDLSYNSLSSEAARLRGLQHLVELQVLSLENNKLNHTGSIQVLKDLPKLQKLDLSANEFTDLDSQGVMFPSSLKVLNLKDNQLSLTHEGYSEICRLMYLQELDLRNNALTTMPNCLGNLLYLRTLDLSNNQLNGNLSALVYSLPSALEYLSLLNNNFNGSFLFKSLVSQRRLIVFKLSSKVSMIQALTESSWVPQFQLKMLKLHNVSLGSSIPGFLLHQHNLRFIDISYNKLIGAFPSWLVQNNTRLQTLLLNNNSLNKLQLPRLIHGLQVLNISSNRIFDSVQEDIGFIFPNLRYMNFASNLFQGTIPSSMGEMKSLQVLDMSSNGLYGELPKKIVSGCYSLKVLKLSNNQLQGKILSNHANFTGLVGLFLDGNNFSGYIGKGLLKSINLNLLDISNNRFSGRLPLWIGRMSSLSYIYMRRNQLKGPFPLQLHGIGLKVMDISHNNFSGPIPRNLDMISLIELRLQSNEFVGSIPNSLFNGEELKVLDLRNNYFSGMILNDIGISAVYELRIILLRNNYIQSHIPEKICQLSGVGILDLSHNKFKGHIPSCLGNIFYGADEFDNFLSTDYRLGVMDIPFMQNWSYRSSLNLDDEFKNEYQHKPASIVDFLTKNRYEAYHGDIINNFFGLDLSSNELSGEIPVEIGNLHNLLSLNLSNNHLTGSIPYNISKLKNLGSLDLSNNKLDGNIPSQLADLSSLGFFNVSYNNLSGEIPFKGHLVTFDENSYIGNAHLCGISMNKSCNPTRVPEPSGSKEAKEEEEEGDDVINMVWLYWTCGAVYISTSLALSVFLCIDSYWSRKWFYQVDIFIHHLQSFKGTYASN